MELKVNKTFDIEEEHFQDIIITALEGGSNEWYLLRKKEFEKDLPPMAGDFSTLTEKISRALYTNPDFKMNVYDIENPEIKLGTVTQESMYKAIKEASEKFPHTFTALMDQDYDANDADILFQLAVMGEVVFG